MTYARIENGNVTEYPVYEGDIRLRYPNTSFPPNFEPPEEYVRVEDVVPPAITPLENLIELLPLQTETGWKRNWVVENASDEEIQQRTESQWTNIRNQRNSLLQRSDWICARSVDTGEPVPEEWKVYRQTLRDITDQEDPFNIVWPTPPE